MFLQAYVFKYPTGTYFTRRFHFLGVAATQEWLASPEGKPEPSGMKGKKNGERLGKQPARPASLKRCSVKIDICLPALQSLEVAPSQNEWTLCSTALRRQRVLATMLHQVQCAAGSHSDTRHWGHVEILLVLRRPWFSFEFIKTLSARLPLCSAPQRGVWLPHCVDGGGSYSYASIPLLPSRSFFILRLKLMIKRLVYETQCSLLIASYLWVL